MLFYVEAERSTRGFLGFEEKNNDNGENNNMSSDNDNNNNHGTRSFFLTFFPHCHPLNEFDYFYYFIYTYM